MGTFDAERLGLRIDPLASGALAIEGLIEFSVAIERVAQACPHADRHHRGAAFLFPIWMMNWASAPSIGLGFKGTDIFAALMFDETTGDRKSTRLNSSHSQISDSVFCLKKK